MPTGMTITGTLTIDAPGGDVILQDTATAPNSGGYDFKLVYNGGGVWNNGPPGQTTYIDDAWALGINIGPNIGTRADTNKQYMALEFESKFYQNGAFGSEFHLATIDLTGVVHRPFTCFLPQDPSAVATGGVALYGQNVTLGNYASSPRVVFDFNYGVINIFNSVSLNYAVNNVPVAAQNNAAGTAQLYLPYIDSGNMVRVPQPMWIVGERTGIGPWPGAATVVQLTGTPHTNDSILLLIGPTFTGDLYGRQASGSITGNFTDSLYNNANAPNANAMYELRTAGAGGGNPFIRLGVNGVTYYTIGIDNADGDKFKIGGFTLGTNTLLTIDGTGAAFGLPIKLPSYTVAGLPGASSAGPGSIVYVSNATGGPTLACSDGTNWRVVAALGAVVS